MKKNLFFILPFLLLATMVQAEIALTVEPITGSDKQYAVSLIGKIKFNQTIMYLYDQSGNELGHTDVSDINKISFKKATTTSFEDVKTGVHVYPNPTQNHLIVSGMKDNQTIRIFDMQGQLLSSTPTKDGETYINVSNLQNGTYLLQIGAEVIKFIKQ